MRGHIETGRKGHQHGQAQSTGTDAGDTSHLQQGSGRGKDPHANGNAAQDGCANRPDEAIARPAHDPPLVTLGQHWLDFLLDFGGDVAIAAVAAPALFRCARVIKARAFIANAPRNFSPFAAPAPLLLRLRSGGSRWTCIRGRAMAREYQRHQAAFTDDLQRAQIADGPDIYCVSRGSWREWNTGNIAHQIIPLSNQSSGRTLFSTPPAWTAALALWPV